jgi:YD repeat-containing protein
VIYPTFARIFAYDARGRKVTETDRLSESELNETRYTYDLSGRMTSRTDKEGKTVYYEYDAPGRLITVTAPAASITHYAYDSRDNLISLIDGENRETRFEYDLNNRLVKEIRPLGQETTYGYDGAGNLVERIDAKNQKTGYVYDNAGRLVEIRYYATAGDTTPVKTVSFTYDDMGNLTGYDDGVTSAVYGYDETYRKVSEAVDYGDFTLSSTIEYFNDGRKKTFTGPDNVTYQYQYDTGGRLAGVQIPDVGFVTIGNYTWNRPTRVTLPGGTEKEYEYDPLMRMKRITSRDPGNNNFSRGRCLTFIGTEGVGI